MECYALTVHTEPFLDLLPIPLLQKAYLIYFYGMIDNEAEDFESGLHSMILKLDMKRTRKSGLLASVECMVILVGEGL